MEFLYYLLEVSALSAIFFGLYFLVFRNETFFRANRYILLSFMFTSFIIPLISITTKKISGSANLLPAMPELAKITGAGGSGGQMESFSLSWQGILLWIYLGGVIFMLVRSLYHTYRLSRLRYMNPSMRKGKMRIIITDRFPSFSFFRWIFIQKDPDNVMQPKSVLEHEMAHASQMHSADLVLFEMAQAVLWFNPFMPLYKKAVLETHEFLADRVVLDSGTDLRDYVDIIVEEIMHNKSYKLASHFKSSNLKKRVIMATKQSSKNAGFKYLLILPVLVLGLLSFSINPDVPQDKGKSELPAIWPLEKSDIKKVAKDFGGPEGEFHSGIDFAAKKGTPVMATAAGVVKAAKEKGDYGNIVYLVHDNKIATLYAHLDKFEVKEGMKVKKGQVIGTVGSTGKSTAPHLHYEVLIDGKSVNPKKVMMKAKQLDEEKKAKMKK